MSLHNSFILFHFYSVITTVLLLVYVYSEVNRTVDYNIIKYIAFKQCFIIILH